MNRKNIIFKRRLGFGKVSALSLSKPALKRLMETQPHVADAAVRFLCSRIREADQQLAFAAHRRPRRVMPSSNHPRRPRRGPVDSAGGIHSTGGTPYRGSARCPTSSRRWTRQVRSRTFRSCPR